MTYKILAVDDEAFNLDIIGEYLEEEGYEVICAEDGTVAMEKLAEHPDIDVVVLDRMMPKMDGIAVVNAMKSSESYKKIPIVMQTAAAQKDQITEGIKAGVYYYLTKPYDKEMFLSIVHATLEIVDDQKKAAKQAEQSKSVAGLMESAYFKIRTLDDAINLGQFIANSLSDPGPSFYALKEFLVNAVEHGNLGISYNEKKDLILSGKHTEKVGELLSLPENREKYATVEYKLDGNQVEITISDQGDGFKWEEYLNISADRAMDPNGRGIATARMNGAFEIEYKGKGNIVSCRTTIK